MTNNAPHDTVESAAGAPRSIPVWMAVGLGIFLLIQVGLVITLWRTNAEVSGLRADIETLGEATSTTLPNLGSSGPATDGPQSAAPATNTDADEPTGPLPRYAGGGTDPALGQTLGSLAALEYYGGESVVVDPGDGVARAYMVWAHWCPYCQEELPMMSEWHVANAAEFENFELISVTTAMDATASNPLVPYLDQNQFPFQVLVDEDGSLSQQLGANAFPFWVFTAPDGTVVGRAAGLIELNDLEGVFNELENLGTQS